MLRLPPSRRQRQHGPRPSRDAERLLRRQNWVRGTAAACVAALAMNASWVYVSLLFDRFFPWYSMLQGIVIGLALRLHGRGLDWRFPLIGAGITCVAALSGSFLAALFLTGREFYTGAWELVDEISLFTVRRFFAVNVGAVDVIYMLFAAALAAFYSKRRLRRGEAAALRRLLNERGKVR